MSLYYYNHAIAIISSLVTFNLYVYLCKPLAFLAALVFLFLVAFILTALTIYHIIVDTARYPYLQINVWPYVNYRSDIKYAWGDDDDDHEADNRPPPTDLPTVWDNDHEGADY